VRILVVDDHTALRAGLAAIIDAQPGLELAGAAADGKEALQRFETLRPDVVTLDLRVPGVDGVRVVQQIIERDPRARVLVMTMFDHETDVVHSARAGALGYILKSASRAEILRAIEAVAAGRRWLPEYVAVKLASGMTAEELTPREQEVEHLQLGISNKEIGRRLDLTEGTVKTHVRVILSKLGAISRTEAVNIGQQRGLLKLRYPLPAAALAPAWSCPCGGASTRIVELPSQR
jgi:DNA-binding NarL/FixJ family response regulator